MLSLWVFTYRLITWLLTTHASLINIRLNIGTNLLLHNDLFIIFRSDYFRNFVDSCLQKIAQDRPTSDVLLKVRGIKYLYNSINYTKKKKKLIKCNH